jgi:hypothetical protein
LGESKTRYRADSPAKRAFVFRLGGGILLFAAPSIVEVSGLPRDVLYGAKSGEATRRNARLSANQFPPRTVA